MEDDVSLITDCWYAVGLRLLFAQMEELHIQDVISWWDVFLLSVRSYTIQYSSHKRRVETRLSRYLTSEIELLQSIPPDHLTTLLVTRLEYLQLRLRDLQRKEIAGYIVRARLPRFEDKEPSIRKYARMAKVSC